MRDFDIGQSIPSYAYGVIRTEPLYIIPAAFSIIFRGAPSAPSGYGDRPAHCPHLPRLIQGPGRIAREGDSLAERIATSFPYVYAHERIADALPRIQDYSEDSIPVLDEENRLLGVVTAQSLIQTLDDALSEDYARLAGLSAEEDLNETLAQSVRKRLPWLLVLLGLGMIVSSVVGLFEGVVAQLTLIVCFQSLVLDMAGNVGTQSLAVAIRVLMDSETTGAQKRKLVRKEARIGLTNGAILGAVVSYYGLTWLLLIEWLRLT